MATSAKTKTKKKTKTKQTTEKKNYEEDEENNIKFHYDKTRGNKKNLKNFNKSLSVDSKTVFFCFYLIRFVSLNTFLAKIKQECQFFSKTHLS